MRVVLSLVAGVVLATGIGVGGGQPVPSSTLDGPLTVNGSVSMTTGPMEIDGGMSALMVTAAAVDAGVVSAQSYSGGTAALSSLAVNGSATLGPTVNATGPLTVTGATSFSQPPTGLVRVGTLALGSSTGVSIGCQTLGTVSVAGTTAVSACAVTQRPAALLSLGVVLDCHVTTPGTVTIRACALVALLSAPAGNYGVTLVGE